MNEQINKSNEEMKLKKNSNNSSFSLPFNSRGDGCGEVEEEEEEKSRCKRKSWFVEFGFLLCGWLWAGPPANAPQKRENKPKPTIKFENGMKKSMKAIHEKQSIC